MPKKYLIWTFITLSLILSPLVFANSGCWQTHNNYSVLMSSSPLSPYEGETASFIFSLVEKGELVKGKTATNIAFQNLNYGDITIDNLYFEDGILSFKQVFLKSGFYEVLVTLKNEEVVLDFPYEVKKRSYDTIQYITYAIVLVTGILVGYSLSKIMKVVT